eukprot:Skav222913  [mRNA]  locus=scaffold1489:220515:220994:+ [translate_table: standard]
MTVPNGNGARERSRSRGQGESLVPIIDIGALSGDDRALQKEVAAKIGKACEEIGFFVVVNHGIPTDVIDTAWNQTLEFFDLPLEEKKKYVSEDEAKNPYGTLAAEVWNFSTFLWCRVFVSQLPPRLVGYGYVRVGRLVGQVGKSVGANQLALAIAGTAA